ncbi:hypothetical protein BDV19DRAFT_390359 [Aspergillus venezuelensis]
MSTAPFSCHPCPIQFPSGSAEPGTAELPEGLPPGWHFTPPRDADKRFYGNETFVLRSGAIHSINALMEMLFSGYYWWSHKQEGFRAMLPQASEYLVKDVLQAIVQGGAKCALSLLYTLDCKMDGVAEEISRTFEEVQWFELFGKMDANARADTGQGLTLVTYVAITWWWIIPPVCAWLLYACGLVGSMLKVGPEGAPELGLYSVIEMFVLNNKGIDCRHDPSVKDSVRMRVLKDGGRFKLEYIVASESSPHPSTRTGDTATLISNGNSVRNSRDSVLTEASGAAAAAYR